MAVASFEDLCAGFCELAKVSMPLLAIDELGRLAFHVNFRGETVNLVHCPQISPDHFFVVFEYGQLAQDIETSSAQLLTAMDANYLLLQVNPPVFSRNPATGDVVLQYVQTLFEATASDLYKLIASGARHIGDWRRGMPVAGPTDAHRGPSADHDSSPAMFHKFA